MTADFGDDRLFDILSDLPRGQHGEFAGRPPNAHFESPENLLATQSLSFRCDPFFVLP